MAMPLADSHDAIERLHQLAPSIAGFGLNGNRRPKASVTVDSDLRMLLSDLGYQRLTGLAMAAAESGWLDFDEHQWEELAKLHRDAMMAALAIESALLTIDEAFRDDGLEYAVLKGPSIAHCAYGDPSLRPFGDLDLLVHSPEWDRASEIVDSIGFKRTRPEAREGFHASFGKALVHRRDDGIELDLHRRLVVGPHGLCIDPEELFEGVRTFELGARAIPRLSDASMFLHVCMHAALGTRTPRLLALRDILEVTGMRGIDWDLAEERARRWNLRAVVPYALDRVSELLGATPPDRAVALAGRLKSSRRERRWLEAYTTEKRGRGGTVTATVSAIPGLRNKARYVGGLLVPNRDFLETRQGSRPSYLRRWRVALRWLLGRPRR